MSTMSLKILTDSEIEKLHKETLNIFENVGVRITHDETLKKLSQAGATVNPASGLVKMPKELVEELLRRAPSTAILSSMNGKEFEVGGNSRHYLSLTIDPYIIDYKDGVRRPNLNDFRRNVIVGNSIDKISGIMRMQFPVSDIPEPDSCLKTLEVLFCNTDKHVFLYATDEANCRDWLNAWHVVAEAYGMDPYATPFATFGVAVTSPLQLHGMNVELLKKAIAHHCPIAPTICPMAGTTSPYSIAGTSLIANTETLLTVIIAQLYKPGHPVFWTWGPSSTNMKTGYDLYYKVEKMLFKTAAAQMGKYYNLPIAGESAGTVTGRADVQNGAEGILNLLASTTGGQNLLAGLGSNYNANGMSTEQIIMTCGLIEMAEYVSRGIDMNDRKLGIESISQAGPGGNYLTDDLTLELLRSDEFFSSPYFDYTGGHGHDGAGMYEIAHQKVEELVANYTPTVPGKVQEAVKKHFAAKYKDRHVFEM